MRVERGGFPESYHQGVLAVVGEDGAVEVSVGDPAWTTFLRSSLKMVQALPLVESGAADAFGLEEKHLALCCASHGGERFHVEGAREILARAGLGEEALLCGAHPPLHEESARDLARAGESPRQIHNNCSGKHAGMLATCVHRGWDTQRYLEADHPLQQEIARRLGELAGADPAGIQHAVDGCGVPTFRLPLVEFGRALARFAGAAEGGSGPMRIVEAMTRHPEMVGGTGRFCTELMRAAGRALLAKVGAEGLFALAWREGRRGRALVAKAAAGDSRSPPVVITDALFRLGVIDQGARESLREFHTGPLRNHAGREVGRMVSLLEWG